MNFIWDKSIVKCRQFGEWSICFYFVVCFIVRKKKILNLYLMRILNVVWEGYLSWGSDTLRAAESFLFSIHLSATMWLLLQSNFQWPLRGPFIAYLEKCSACLLFPHSLSNLSWSSKKHSSLQPTTLSVFSLSLLDLQGLYFILLYCLLFPNIIISLSLPCKIRRDVKTLLAF